MRVNIHRLWDLIAKEDMSVTPLSLKIGVGRATLGNVLKTQQALLRTVERLSNYFSVPVEELIIVPNIERLEHLITKRGETITGVEKMTGLGHRTLHRLMQGRTVKLETLQKLSAYFGVPVVDLLKDRRCSP